MNKSEIYDYINQYPHVDREKIKMAWNGKRGLAFFDYNQTLRGNVIVKVMEEPSIQNAQLIRDLFSQEADWSSKSLSYRYYLTEMLEWLILNDFEASSEVISDSFRNNHSAIKCFHDLTISDEQINNIIDQLTHINKMTSKVHTYQHIIDELKNTIVVRDDHMKQKKAFDQYVTERDKVHVAAKKNFIQFLKEGEMTYIALFILIPIVLVFGYYFYGLNVLIGMIPMAIAYVTLYVIFLIVKFIIR